MDNITAVVLVSNDEFWLPYALESVRGRFNKYIIYDIGSLDGTRNVIEWFKSTEKAEFFTRFLPMCDPKIQGAFRNSMIAEAQTDFYYILDGDEVYSPESLDSLEQQFIKQKQALGFHPEKEYNPIYGVCRRKEISSHLSGQYSEQRTHHRLYHRTAIWKGTHPGEEAVIKQNKKTEYDLEGVLCYHFHNSLRSSFESSVPKRIERKTRATYSPGDIIPINLLDELPILRKPIENFPVNPELRSLQENYDN